MCVFNVCGMVLYVFGKFGCFVPVCVSLGSWGLWGVYSEIWERFSVCIWKQRGCVGLCVQELWSICILGLWDCVWVFFGWFMKQLYTWCFLRAYVSTGYLL